MIQSLMELEDVSIQDTLGKSLIQEVSLHVNENEFVGIVGETGSGKTLAVKSALDLLANDLNVSYQSRNLLGKSLDALNSRERRQLIGKEIGFIPQNTVVFLHPMIKIKSQIIDAYISHIHHDRKQALQKAAELLDKVGIQDPKQVLDSYPMELSGGMKQRVNIAMALMTDPKLIVADEPTTALDTVVQRQVMEFLQSIYKKAGVSILFISHDLKIINEFCDRVYVMYQGSVVESGYTEKVFTSPQHWYSKKLISLIPTLTKQKQA